MGYRVSRQRENNHGNQRELPIRVKDHANQTDQREAVFHQGRDRFRNGRLDGKNIVGDTRHQNAR